MLKKRNNYLANWIQPYTKGLVYHSQAVVIPGMQDSFNNWRIHVIQYVDKLRQDNRIIWIDTFHKRHPSDLKKTLSKRGEENSLNLIRNVCEKLTLTLIVEAECFSLKTKDETKLPSLTTCTFYTFYSMLCWRF
jgi:hypothetical protein